MVAQLNNILGPAIDSTLRYYAMFRYPLQAEEIRRSCQVPCTTDDILENLHRQVSEGRVYSHEGFYATLPDIAAIVQRRKEGNTKAAAEIPQARRAGRFIYAFPFVRFVGISGSLSKGFSDHQTDFDFFIITRKDRLWISRTLLHFFKKFTFLTGHQHNFCMNYFIAEDALQLEEKNIYTATELMTLIPVCGDETYRELLKANAWIHHFLPNQKPVTETEVDDRQGWIKKSWSGLINLLHPSGVNRLLMRLTDAKWRRKWAGKGYPAEDYNLAFRTTINISKNHPANYQKRILEGLKTKNQ